MDGSSIGARRVRADLYVYELDDHQAAEFARRVIGATIGETVETVRLLNVHELTDYGMKPGDVKQYI